MSNGDQHRGANASGSHPAPGGTAAGRPHPAGREVLPEDPMMLHGGAAAGDPLVMLRAIVEEYARIGWGSELILGLFDSPQFIATHGLQRALGRERIEAEVRAILGRHGVFRVRTGTAPPAAADDTVTRR